MRMIAISLLAWIGVGACSTPAITATSPELVRRVEKAGAENVVQHEAPNGGAILLGKLEGRDFVLAVPSNWTREVVLFGQGYSTPGATPVVPEDPIAKDPGGGSLRYAYEQGIAVGIAAFDKSGVATQSGVANTLRLRALAQKLGGNRFYMLGGSMGGNIVIALIEQHPKAFDGAVSMCGVTEGWIAIVDHMMEMRAAYNLLTEGTAYELPGVKDVTRSALPTIPSSGETKDGTAFRNAQTMRIIMPVVRLFQAAKANPDGPAAIIARRVADIGGFAVDPAAIAAPLYSAALGMDDIVATMGGLPAGNVGKIYKPVGMTEEEAERFNQKIQRFDATPAAVTYAQKWHEATGRFSTPLVTVHQRLDALVPFSQSEGFGRRVSSVGNQSRLAQYAVAETHMPVPGGLEGLTHCGFSNEQNIDAFQSMRAWVKTGRRPAPDAVR